MNNQKIKDAEFKKKNIEETPVRIMMISMSCLLFISVLLLALFFLSSCTLSFQNISTHGTATDLVDEELKTSPKTDGTLNMAPL